jgi:hypothetical protein
MSDALPLQRAHGCSVRLEISIQGRPTVLSGLGRYGDGKLWIDVKDQEGDFTLCVDQSTWDGELLKQGDTFLIRLRSQ